VFLSLFLKRKELYLQKLMDKKEIDILYFISFCIEEYKEHTGKTGCEISSLFDQYNVYSYLYNNFDTLHTQGSSWLMAEIDDYIKNKEK
jgi:hypothetical protein